MKKIKIIQYIMIVIALWTVLYLIDSIEVNRKELIASFVLTSVVVVNYVCFRFYESKYEKR